MGCVEQVGRTSLDVCQAQREDYMECLHNTKLVGVSNKRAPKHLVRQVLYMYN